MRLVTRLVVPLLVLGVLLVAADRAGAWAAERAVADQVAAELEDQGVDSAPPEVTVDEVPFLTQVVAGRYDSVTVRLRDLGLAGMDAAQVRGARATLVASDVHADVGTLASGEGEVVADRVDGTVRVAYDDVVAQLGFDGVDLSAGSASDLVRVRAPVSAFGAQLTAVGTARVTLADQQVRVSVEELTLEEDPGMPGGDEALAAAAERLSASVTLPALPYGLTVESVRADDDGLAATVAARDVVIAGGG